MRTDTLYGTKFAESRRMKGEVLSQYAEWKQSVVYGFDSTASAKFAFGQLMGLSDRELASMAGKESGLPAIEEIEDLLSERGCRPYVIANSVLKWSGKMTLPEDFELKELERIPDGKRQLNYGNNFYRYEKKDGALVVMSAHEVPDGDKKGRLTMDFDFYRIDLANQLFHTTDAAHRKKFEQKQHQRFFQAAQDMLERRAYYRQLPPPPDDKAPQSKQLPDNSATTQQEIADFENGMQLRSQHRHFFLKLISFMEMAQVQHVHVQPGEHYHHRDENIKMDNREAHPMTWVTNNWDKSISTDKFFVDPFYRWQRCGKGFSEVRRKYIFGFWKNGYNLKAGKLRAQENELPDLPPAKRTASADKPAQDQGESPSLKPAGKVDNTGHPMKKERKIDYSKLGWKGKFKRK